MPAIMRPAGKRRGNGLLSIGIAGLDPPLDAITAAASQPGYQTISIRKASRSAIAARVISTSNSAPMAAAVAGR